MLNNYLKIAFRNLRKHSSYTTLNVLGLGLGVACCILIFMLVRYHLSFDQYHAKSERIARIVSEVHVETLLPIPGAPNPTANAIQSEVAIVEKAAMYITRNQALISVSKGGATPDKYKEEDAFAFVQPELFEILDYPLLRGDLSAMKEPNTAVLTERLARKYFEGEDALGKTIRYENKVDFRIVGILRDLPDNTDYPQELLASWATLKTMLEEAGNLDNWGGISSGTLCFVLLQNGRKISELQAAMPAFTQRHPHPEDPNIFQYLAKPLLSLHFDTDYGAGVDKKFLWALALIGVFLLITACVNFVNMATAQALKRVREVGVRKSLGSTRGQLFWQFMFETGLIVLAALLVGSVLAITALPYLNQWADTTLRFDGPGLKVLLPFALLLGVALTFLAGAYPGVMQARFRAVESLKGGIEGRRAGGFSLRRILVTTQFAISQMLIIGAAVVVAQMRYARNADWGFRPGAVLTMEVPEPANMKNLKQQLAGIAGVKNVSLCFQPPASGANNQTGVRYDNRPEGEPWIVNIKPADSDYLETFGLTLVAGRNLQPSDTIREYLVNETFVRKLNIASPDLVLNKKVVVDGTPGIIAGVLRDFHNWQLSMPISAIAIGSDMKSYTRCAVQLMPGDPKAVLPKIREVWENNYPNHYFEQEFMEEQLAEFLETETIILRLIGTFSGIAIFVGCLGLYGLSAFMVARKRKEIGIRKALGESISGVLWLFSKEYIRLIVLAFVLAAPVAWWVMNGWLADYQYHISIGAGIFALSLLATFLVAIITVGAQSVRAALANPVNSLRSE